MHYRRAVEQNTRDTHEQIKAKEEEITTTTFTSGEYASLCRGDTSKVPVLSLLSICSAVMASIIGMTSVNQLRIATANPTASYYRSL